MAVGEAAVGADADVAAADGVGTGVADVEIGGDVKDTVAVVVDNFPRRLPSGYLVDRQQDLARRIWEYDEEKFRDRCPTDLTLIEVATRVVACLVRPVQAVGASYVSSCLKKSPLSPLPDVGVWPLSLVGQLRKALRLGCRVLLHCCQS